MHPFRAPWAWMPQQRPRRVQSAARALPNALGDVFRSSLGIPSSALGCPWAVLERSGPSWAQNSGGLPSSTFASRPPQFHPHSFKHHPQSPNHSKPSPGLQRPVEAARGGPAAGGVALKIRHSALGHSRGVFALVGSSLSLRFHFAHCV